MAYTQTFCKSQVWNLINTFRPNPVNEVETIQNYVSYVLYDNRTAQFDIVLKVDEIFNDKNYKMIETIRPEVQSRKDFDLREIIIGILRTNPNLRIPEIRDEALKTWNGFSYTSIKKTVYRLVDEKRIVKVGNKRGRDGYILYRKGLDISSLPNKRENDTLQVISKFDYYFCINDLAKAMGICWSRARYRIECLIEKGLLDEKRIVEEKKNLGKDIYQQVEDAIKENPYLTKDELAKKLHVCKKTVYVKTKELNYEIVRDQQKRQCWKKVKSGNRQSRKEKYYLLRHTVLNLLKENPAYTVLEMQERCEFGHNGIIAAINEMKEFGLIEGNKHNKAFAYTLHLEKEEEFFRDETKD